MPDIKIHPPVIRAVTDCLKAVFEEGKVADKEVHFLLKQNKQFGSRDRAFIAESVYDVVRWRRRYEYQLAQSSTPLTYYKHLMLMSLLRRGMTPLQPDVFGVSTAVLTELQHIAEMPLPSEDIAQSYPKELYDFCAEQIGEKWPALAAALNEPPAVYIRVNTLKTSREKLLPQLQELGLEVLPVRTEIFPEQLADTAGNALQIISKNNLKNSALYREGLFEFQDIGSQAIGTFLFKALQHRHIAELRVLDLCAGAGGKTLHLSALMGNRGKIFATDYNAARLKNLAQRAQQAGCENIEIIDYKTAAMLKNIDIVLMDAPCSGTGTFRRQADLKYKTTPQKIEEYRGIQAGLLHDYSRLLHAGGQLVYATCSILPQENDYQIQAFLQTHPDMESEHTISLWPTAYPGDGFFMAMLKKKYM